MEHTPHDQKLRPLRLLHVADSLDVGGGERHVIDLARAQQRRGYVVTIACSAGGALAKELDGTEVRVRLLGRRLVKRRVSPAYAWALATLVRREGFDLVHSHMYASNAAAAAATLGTRTPLVVTEHSEGSWRSRRARILARRFLGRARHVIAVTDLIRQRVVRRDGVRPERVTVIPGCVTVPAGGRGGERPELPARLEGKRLVGVVARLQEEKGVRYFVEAAAALAPEWPDVRWVVVGDGPLRSQLEELAARLGLKDIAFLGLRTDARALIPLLEMLVVPSVSEGTPLVNLEAMHAGVPIVASRVGGIPTQVRHGREALLVPPADPGALGEAIRAVLESPDLAHHLGAAGKARAEARYGYDSLLDRTEAVYRSVLGLPEPFAVPTRRAGRGDVAGVSDSGGPGCIPTSR